MLLLVDDLEKFGIVKFGATEKAIFIEEKRAKPKSNYCVTGLYFYDNRVVGCAKNLKHSACGELEFTDLNRIYLKGELTVSNTLKEYLIVRITWVFGLNSKTSLKQ